MDGLKENNTKGSCFFAIVIGCIIGVLYNWNGRLSSHIVGAVLPPIIAGILISIVSKCIFFPAMQFFYGLKRGFVLQSIKFFSIEWVFNPNHTKRIKSKWVMHAPIQIIMVPTTIENRESLSNFYRRLVWLHLLVGIGGSLLLRPASVKWTVGIVCIYLAIAYSKIASSITPMESDIYYDNQYTRYELSRGTRYASLPETCFTLPVEPPTTEFDFNILFRLYYRSVDQREMNKANEIINILWRCAPSDNMKYYLPELFVEKWFMLTLFEPEYPRTKEMKNSKIIYQQLKKEMPAAHRALASYELFVENHPQKVRMICKKTKQRNKKKIPYLGVELFEYDLLSWIDQISKQRVEREKEIEERRVKPLSIFSEKFFERK